VQIDKVDDKVIDEDRKKSCASGEALQAPNKL